MATFEKWLAALLAALGIATGGQPAPRHHDSSDHHPGRRC